MAEFPIMLWLLIKGADANGSSLTMGPTVTWHRQKVKNLEYQRKEKVEFGPNRK